MLWKDSDVFEKLGAKLQPTVHGKYICEVELTQKLYTELPRLGVFSHLIFPADAGVHPLQQTQHIQKIFTNISQCPEYRLKTIGELHPTLARTATLIRLLTVCAPRGTKYPADLSFRKDLLRGAKSLLALSYSLHYHSTRLANALLLEPCVALKALLIAWSAHSGEN